MNAERLLEVYEQISEAPDAIARLRRFVLDLAVRGKLVEQDAGDEPASQLLEQIAVEKAKLVSSGHIKAPKPQKTKSAIESDFAIPSGWVWTSLETVAACLDFMRKPINGTERDKRIDGLPQDKLYPYFGATQQQGWIDDFIFDDDLILLGEDGVPFHDPLRNKAYKISGRTWVNNHAHVFKCILTSLDFVTHYLNVFDYSGRVVGATRSKLNQARALTIPVPLPPLAEQHRIVAKVDELMALCDRLEGARKIREEMRDKLTAASLARLTAPDTTAGDFPTHATFALEALPALTTRPDQFKTLRQTILNLAVRGKLVEQDPADEAISLGRNASAVGAIALPPRWHSTRLVNLLSETTRNGYSRRPDDAENGTPILRISAGTVRQDGLVAEEEHKLISGIDQKAREQYGLRQGDLLACRFNGNKAYVGRLTLFNDYLGLNPIYPDKLIRVRVDRSRATPEFIRMAGESDLVRACIEEFCATTVGNWGISASNLKEVVFPVPPLAEQHRIVAKVDALMALCDRLEAALSTTDTTRTRLLEALLHETLDPATDTLKAAE